MEALEYELLVPPIVNLAVVVVVTPLPASELICFNAGATILLWSISEKEVVLGWGMTDPGREEGSSPNIPALRVGMGDDLLVLLRWVGVADIDPPRELALLLLLWFMTPLPATVADRDALAVAGRWSGSCRNQCSRVRKSSSVSSPLSSADSTSRE